MSDDRKRLEKLLGMLGSSFDGERANAASMIAALAERNKMTIAEFVLGALPQKQRHEPRASSHTVLDALAEISAEAGEWEFTLTEWEGNFARDVSARYTADYELSEKQLAIAEKIIRKVQLARERGGPR
jgi:hypothetical protein